MLKQNIAHVADGLADVLHKDGIYLTPLPGSPLQILVEASLSPSIETSQKLAQYSQEPDDSWRARDLRDCLLEDIQKPSFDGSYAHDEKMADAIRVISASIKKTLYTAQNVALPIINTISGYVHTAQQEQINQAANVLQVRAVEYEEIWASPGLWDMVKVYDNYLGKPDLKVMAFHKPRADNDVLELLKTGAASFDKEVDAFVESVGINFITEVYSRYFVTGYRDWVEDGKQHKETPVYWFGSGSDDRNTALTLFLMTRKLKDELDEEINMSLLDYTTQMTNILADVGRTVCRYIETRDNEAKNAALIRSYPAEGSETWVECPEAAVIEVNDDVYRPWLEAGGTPEILCGAFVTDCQSDGKKLLEKKEYYEAAWDRRVAILRSARESSTYNTVVSALRTSITKAINDLDEQYLENGSRGPLHQRFQQELSKVTIHRLENIYGLVRCLVCDTMFPKTNIKDLLERLDKVSKDNPKRPLEECATIVTIDILCTWVSQCFVVNRE